VCCPFLLPYLFIHQIDRTVASRNHPSNIARLNGGVHLASQESILTVEMYDINDVSMSRWYSDFDDKCLINSDVTFSVSLSRVYFES
jgi:hypothetical protein